MGEGLKINISEKVASSDLIGGRRPIKLPGSINTRNLSEALMKLKDLGLINISEGLTIPELANKLLRKNKEFQNNGKDLAAK